MRLLWLLFRKLFAQKSLQRPVLICSGSDTAGPEPKLAGHGSAAAAVTVGLDFGTHSTKVLLRPRNSEVAQLLRIDKGHQDYPWFASPSLVRVSDSKVYFGTAALEMTGGTLYRSLKVELLTRASTEKMDQTSRSHLTPDILAAWYLSWVLGGIKHSIERYFPQAMSRLSVNVAAPMSHIEDESLKTRYLTIVQAAWQSAFADTASPARQGMPVHEGLERFCRWLSAKVEAKETRRFDVLPETVAAIVSASLDPRMEPGMYMIVDIGAGSTEISVNHVGELGAEQRVLCYQDISIRFGGDNFDWIQRECRDEFQLPQRYSQLTEHLGKVFRRTWGSAYAKDGRNRASRDRWRKFRVLFTGGGAKKPGIEQAIMVALPLSPFPVGELEYRVTWHTPINVELRSKGESQSSHLLAVAHGLSMPRQQWPVVFWPEEVEEQEPPESIAQPPPFWYLDE